MHLYIHIYSDSGSRAAAILFLGSAEFNGTDKPGNFNGCIATLTKIIPTVCAAASESEYAALFMAGQIGEGIRQTLYDLGHQQLQTTTIIYDNKISGKIANKKCKIRRSKAIAARYHWVQNRISSGTFQIV